MNNDEFNRLIASATARYNALSPEEKAAHDYEQRRSFVRGMCPSDRDYKMWCRMVDRILPPGDIELSGLTASERADARLTRIEQQLITTSREMEKILMSLQDEINRLRGEVARQTTVTQGAVTMLKEFADKLNSAVENDDMDEVKELADAVTANTNALASALAANTPAAPTEPPLPPDQPAPEQP